MAFTELAAHRKLSCFFFFFFFVWHWTESAVHTTDPTNGANLRARGIDFFLSPLCSLYCCNTTTNAIDLASPETLDGTVRGG